MSKTWLLGMLLMCAFWWTPEVFAAGPSVGEVFGGLSSAVPFLFGAFCALWAQNTGRSAWLWYFFGLLLNVIAVIALLIKNSADIEERTEREGLGLGSTTPPPVNLVSDRLDELEKQLCETRALLHKLLVRLEERIDEDLDDSG